MKIKNEDLNGLLVSFNKLKDVTGHKFVIPFLRNKELIKEEVELLLKLKEESEDFIKFKDEIQVKQIEFADKNEDGSPKLDNIPQPDGSTAQRVIIESKENRGKLDKAINKLVKDNKELLDLQNKKEIEYIKSLSGECLIKFHIIKAKDLPEDITIEQMETLSFMIDLT